MGREPKIPVPLLKYPLVMSKGSTGEAYKIEATREDNFLLSMVPVWGKENVSFIATGNFLTTKKALFSCDIYTL